MHDALVAISELGMNRFAATGRSSLAAVRISIVAGCGDLAGGAEITFWLARFDVRRRSGASRVASDKEKKAAMIAIARPAVGELTQTTLARVFVNPERGVLLFANNLPRLESGKVFEMWLVPKSGVPRPAGAFRADDAGGDCGDGAVGGAGERIAGSANAVSGDGCLADR